MLNKEEVYDLIKKHDIGMMTNINEDGNLVSHPMTRQGDIEDDSIWFFSKKNSEKVREILKNRNVNVSFSDSDYISISGIAEIVDDVKTKQELWSKELDAFYDGGPENDQIILLKVKIDSLEYWTSDNFLKSAFEFAKGVVTGEKSDMGKHDAMDI